jgi:drug/metabolite transporter (DMT)-like permease
MARLTLGRIAVLQFVYPLTAVLVDWLVYSRTLNRVQIGGMVLMALALWTIRLGSGGSENHDTKS